MTGARFSNVEKIEVQEFRHALSMDMLAKRARNFETTEERVQTRQLRTKALISAYIVDQCSFSLTMLVVAVSPR